MLISSTMLVIDLTNVTILDFLNAFPNFKTFEKEISNIGKQYAYIEKLILAQFRPSLS